MTPDCFLQRDWGAPVLFFNMHCNKKVGAMSHRLHPPAKKILRAPLSSTQCPTIVNEQVPSVQWWNQKPRLCLWWALFVVQTLQICCRPELPPGSLQLQHSANHQSAREEGKELGRDEEVASRNGGRLHGFTGTNHTWINCSPNH